MIYLGDADSPLTLVELSSVMSGVAGAISAIAIIISTAFAVMMYALMRKNSKQANALEVLRDFENDRDIIQERKKYRALLKSLNSTDLDDYAYKLKQYALPANQYTDESALILAVLNRYEFIAVGIRTGAIDEKLIKLWTKTAFVRTITMLSRFIAERQKGEPCAFSELHWLAHKWSKGLDSYRPILKKNLPAPQIKEIRFISPIIRVGMENWIIIILLAFQTIILASIL